MREAIERLREAEKKATPGPWGACLGSGNIECTAVHFEGDEQHPYGKVICDLLTDYILEDDPGRDISGDMNFIIEARNTVPLLLAELERLSAENDEIIATLARMRGALLSAYPEKTPAVVSCPVECALELEAFQTELIQQRDTLAREAFKKAGVE